MRKTTSTNFANEKFLEYDCPFMTTLRFIGKRWRPALLWKLSEGTHRYGALKRAVANISDKMLAATLHELEADGLVRKTIYAEMPPRTEYHLTSRGEELLPLLREMNRWGTGAKEEIRRERKGQEPRPDHKSNTSPIPPSASISRNRSATGGPS